ncbi:MAG: hypothetical protein Q9207_004212 [Kuettlingeria erythrocarpa]
MHLVAKGKHVEAEEMQRRTLALREEALGKEHPDTLESMACIGQTLSAQKRYMEAEEMFQRALLIANHLGHLHRNQGKLVKAEKMHQRALDGYKRLVGSEHIWTLDTVENLALLYQSQSKLVEAEGMLQQVLGGYEKLVGREHRYTLHAVEKLGHLHRNQGKLVEAEQMFQRALDGYKELQGYEHISGPGISNNLRRLKACQVQRWIRGRRTDPGPG